MAHYLFPALDSGFLTPIHRRDYACLLTEISRASEEAIEALTLFDRLVRGGQLEGDGPGFIAFDAHCGDTGCHLRAGMMREYAREMQARPSQYTWWLFPAINNLTRTQQKAREWCSLLTQRALHPGKLGLDEKHETSQSILEKLGWSESSHHGELELDADLEEDVYSETRSNTSSSISSRASSVSDASRTSHTLSSSPLTNSTDSLAIPAKRQQWPICTVWNMHDPITMIRFIVFSFILSRYKRFYRTQAGGHARLLPHAALAYGNALIAPHRNFKHDASRPGNTRRVELEFRRLQNWLTDLSCAWLRYIDDRAPVMGSLVAKTILLSPRGLKVAACFPAFLILRKHLALDDAGIIMIDRHFCSRGIHHNVFRANITLDQTDESYCRPRAEWGVTRITESDHSCRDEAPSICIIGNSINGSHSAFQDRALQDTVAHDTECQENEAHVTKFLATDTDRLVTSLFALHSLYPFTLECTGGEEAFFKDCLYGYDAVETAYQRSRCEALRLGVSESDISVWRPEHIFLETESKITSMLRTWSPDEGLLPLSDGLIAKEFAEP